MAWSPKTNGQRASGARSEDAGQQARTGGLVRIAVVGVMMRCVTHLPPDDFFAELPRIITMVSTGLSDRDVDHRRAARQAVQRVATALGPQWMGWMMQQLSDRLYRGFMIPVCAAASLAALQAIADDRKLNPGDFDNAFPEIIIQMNRELDAKQDMEEEVDRPGLVPEAKKPKGPELVLLASQHTTPSIVTDAIWALQQRVRGEAATKKVEPKKGKKMALAEGPVTSLSHLHRIEELMQKMLSGLSLNAAFVGEPQARFAALLLDATARLLKGDKSADIKGDDPGQEEPDQHDSDPIIPRVAKARDERLTIQAGAAAGRAAPVGVAAAGAGGGGVARRAKGAGADEQTRAGVLGVLGLKLLQQVLKRRTVPVLAQAPDADVHPLAALYEGEVVSAVIACFCSRQDRLFVASARCLGRLRGLYAARPGVLGAHGILIAKTVLKNFETIAGAPSLSQHLQAKLRSRGLASANATAMLATSTRLLSALLNNKQSVDWFKTLGEEKVELKNMDEDTRLRHRLPEPSKVKKGAAAEFAQSNFFDALVTHIRSALDQPALQPSALQLLRRVLLRNRMLSAAVYQCVDAVGDVMIVSAGQKTAQQCAQIYVDFMLDYPHEPKALQQRLAFLVRNLGYAEETGRHAVLNCLYLAVTHFPAEELASKWGALIFAGAAARLPQETDPTAHQMLHVLLKGLLSRVGAPGRHKLLDLALSWGRSPKLGLHLALAEILGLFAEASAGNSDAATAAAVRILPALAERLDTALAQMQAQSELLALQPAALTQQPWRVVYASCKAFERVLAAFPPQLLERLPSAPVVPVVAAVTSPTSATLEEEEAAGTTEDSRKKRPRKEGGATNKDATQTSEAGSPPPVVATLAPDAALASLWRFTLGGKDAFTQKDRHSWVIAVSLRIVESQFGLCADEKQAAKWFSGGLDPATNRADVGPATFGSRPSVTAPALLRALDTLLSSERLEQDHSIAPLGVRALCSLTKLMLQNPSLMPEEGWGDEEEEKGIVAEHDENANDSEEEENDDEDKNADEEMKAVHEAVSAAKEEHASNDAPASASGSVNAPVPMPTASRADKAREDNHIQQTDIEESKVEIGKDEKTAAVDNGEKSKFDEAEDKEDGKETKAAESDEGENDEEAAVDGADEPEGERVSGPSLFEQVGKPAAAAQPSLDLSSLAAGRGEGQGPGAVDIEASLRRSRVRWLIVRTSHRARALLKRPSFGVVRLVSAFRYYAALVEALPVEVLIHVMEPIVGICYRCSSAFTPWPGESNLPDVQTLEEVLNLSTSQKMEFLAQLAQGCLDTLTSRCQAGSKGPELTRALAKVRQAVDRRRADRHQKRKLLPIVNAEAAAIQRRARTKKKQEGKKRKVQEIIMTRKGGSGRTRIKQSRTLV